MHPASMRVLLHAPAAWYLLQQEGVLYLDVNCELSFSSFSVLIRLSEEEAARVRLRGRAFIDAFAADISLRPREYLARHLPALADTVSAAVLRWRESGAADRP